MCQKRTLLVSKVVGYFDHKELYATLQSWTKLLETNAKFKWAQFFFSGEEHNFLQLSSTEIDSRNEPYDYGSIMHYGKSTFAKEVSQITILPKKDPRTSLIPEIGQREQLSAGDIRQTSKMYRCPGKELFITISQQ